jgi:quinol---cytochrome c reductase cytochrome c subunit, bacillus type
MTEIPEHLRKRAEEARAKAEAAKAAAEPAAAAEAPAEPPADAGAPADEAASRIPAHLLERSRAAKAAASAAGGDAGAEAGGGGGVAVAERPATITPTAPLREGAIPVGAGPGGHTQRLLTVVKSGSIQDVKATPVDKVHTWPHLLAGEFVASLVCLAFVFVFSVFVNAPLLRLANPNQTPNPSKAPWYFLGLQELLTMFHPMVAGVTIPGMGIFLLILTPYMDKNPSHKPEDRKFTIGIFTIFMMFWAVLVLIGSFFRGPGQNFVLPWKSGIFFDL